MVRLLVFLIRCYKTILSPLLGTNCRFYPTCSSYCIEALEQHGLIKGLCLGVSRIGRCHPMHEGGIDPVPECNCSGNSTNTSKALSSN